MLFMTRFMKMKLGENPSCWEALKRIHPITGSSLSEMPTWVPMNYSLHTVPSNFAKNLPYRLRTIWKNSTTIFHTWYGSIRLRNNTGTEPSPRTSTKWCTWNPWPSMAFSEQQGILSKSDIIEDLQETLWDHFFFQKEITSTKQLNSYPPLLRLQTDTFNW